MRQSSERASALTGRRLLVAESLEDRRLLSGLGLLESRLLPPFSQPLAVVAALATASAADSTAGLPLGVAEQVGLSVLGLDVSTFLSLDLGSAPELGLDLGLETGLGSVKIGAETALQVGGETGLSLEAEAEAALANALGLVLDLETELGDSEAVQIGLKAGLEVGGENGLSLDTAAGVALGHGIVLGAQIDTGLGSGAELGLEVDVVVDQGIAPVLDLRPEISLGANPVIGPEAGGGVSPAGGGDLGPALAGDNTPGVAGGLGPSVDPTTDDVPSPSYFLGSGTETGTQATAPAFSRQAVSGLAGPGWFLFGFLGSDGHPERVQPDAADPEGLTSPAGEEENEDLATDAVFLEAGLWAFGHRSLGPIGLVGGPPAGEGPLSVVTADASVVAGMPLDEEVISLPQAGGLLESGSALDGMSLEQFLQGVLAQLDELGQELTSLLARLGIQPWVLLALAAAVGAGEIARRSLRQAQQDRVAGQWLPGAASVVES